MAHYFIYIFDTLAELLLDMGSRIANNGILQQRLPSKTKIFDNF
jgi:hypothetical protein